jgi:hypothetical protein
MTYKEAIEALITAGYLSEADSKTALAALTSTETDFTYPDWAQALVRVGLLEPLQAEAAANVMEQAAVSTDMDDDTLENAGIL